MRVEIKYKTSFIFSFKYLFLDVINSRSDIFRRFLPNSIRIDTSKFCSSVAMYNSIRIEHGYDFENVAIIKWVAILHCFKHELEKIVDDPFNHKTRSSLNRMLPCNYPDNFAIYDGLFTSWYRNQIDCVLTDCLAEFFYTQDVCVFFVWK